MTALPLHVDIHGFSVEDNCLRIAGRKLTEVMAGIDVPAYLYDSGLIRERIATLRRVLPEGVDLHYAIKANPMQEVVDLVAPLVDGLDVASARELDTALRAQMPPASISFAGPGKVDSELEAAVRSGITVNAESPNELARLSTLARKIGRKARVAIRVNPAFEVKGSGMRMSGGPKPFGIDAEVVPQILSSFDTDHLDFVGFHIFSGSQNLHAPSIAEAQRRSITLAIELSAFAPSPPKTVNIGGGFGIPYFKGDQRLDLELVSAELDKSLRIARQSLPEARIVLELGRFIVGEAGIYVCRIVDRKVSRGRTFLITNGGLHQHLAASGNFGQVIRKDYPCLIGNKVFSRELQEVTVVGPLCTPLDVLAAKLDVPVETNVGDLVVVMQSGAYGLTASPVNFLSHPEPVERLL